MTSGKLRTLPVRAFGAEPANPDIPSLADWVAERRGTQGDILSFLLEKSLVPQKEAGVTVPCAGGRFCRERVLASLIGLEGQAVTGEIGVDPGAYIADTADAGAIVKGVALALPAPNLIGLDDRYYNDEDEFRIAISGAYRILMRASRDAGCSGHVLLCDRIEEPEIAALAGKKVFFFHPAPARHDLEVLLEYQQRVAVRKEDVGTVLSLTSEYDIAGFVIIDPDSAAIRSMLLHEDPEKVSAGGYCTTGCPDYWKSLVDSAVYRT